MNQLQAKLLELIQLNNGKYSWYQLDRAISFENVEGRENLMENLKTLQSQGFITSQQGPNPSQPTYSITENGLAVLKTTARG